jgi:glycine reductase complex component B subunit alpha and beta
MRSPFSSNGVPVPLELASYPVDSIALDEAAAALALDDPCFARVEVDVVRPGDPVRLTHVLDAVEPRGKADDPDATFPGALGALRPAGRGRTNRIDGAAVIACASFPAEERTLHEQEAIVDMAGPGADHSLVARTANVVLTFYPADGVGNQDFEAAIRAAKLRAARDLAATTIGHEPAAVERLEYELGGGGELLPSVALLLQLSSLGPLYEIYLYGTTLDGFQPAPLSPLEVLDGALTCGEYHWAGLRNPTYHFQRSALVRELLSADGERLRFAGLVACRGYNQSAKDKERAAMLAAKMASDLGADGAIVTTDAGGNSHTDTMLTVRACERVGIRTVALVAEMGGLTDCVPEADAIVSVGNAEELVEEWLPQRVIGGETLLDGRSALGCGPVPVRTYLGATCQMGDLDLRAVSW